MSKRILSVLMIIALAFTFVGCGKGGDSSDEFTESVVWIYPDDEDSSSSDTSGDNISSNNSSNGSSSSNNSSGGSSGNGTVSTPGGNNAKPADRKNFAGMTPATPYKISQKEWDQYTQLGIKTIRLDVLLKDGMGGDINNIYFGAYDSVVKEANKRGIEVVMLLGYDSFKANNKKVADNKYLYNFEPYKNDKGETVTENYMDLVKAAEKIVPHYAKMGVKNWEIWNEENGMWRLDPANYMELLTTIYEKFKYTDKWDPSANVAIGGIDAVNVNFPQGINAGTVSYIKELLSTEEYKNFKKKYNRDPFDAIGIHPYNTVMADESGKITKNDLATAMEAYAMAFDMKGADPSIPFWLTEYGDQSKNTHQKASAITAMVAEAWKIDRISRLHYFKYHYLGQNYRIVDDNYNPLPEAFDALKNAYKKAK